MFCKPVQCPFNPQHIMPRETLQKHIIKCMKNYPGWLACPYNAMHRVPNSNCLTEHVSVCSDKDTLSIFLESKASRNIPNRIEASDEINFLEENWDEELKRND